jgi:hypothetical protein
LIDQYFFCVNLLTSDRDILHIQRINFFVGTRNVFVIW